MPGGNLIYVFRVQPKSGPEDLVTVEAPDGFRAMMVLAMEMPGVHVLALVGTYLSTVEGRA